MPCWTVVTASSRIPSLHGNDASNHPNSLAGQHLWLCWDARRGTGDSRFAPRYTPAALVSDDGWVVHGMLNVADARPLVAEGLSIDKASAAAEPDQSASATSAPRPLRRHDPGAAWPLFVSPATLLLVACYALLTCDILGILRWVTGAGGIILEGSVAVASAWPLSSALRRAKHKTR